MMEEKAAKPILNPVLGAEGTLLWREPGTRAVDFMSAFGTLGSFGVSDATGKLLNHPLLGLAKDSRDQFWLFNDRTYGRMPVDQIWGNRKAKRFGPLRPFLREPLAFCTSADPCGIAPGLKGEVWFAEPSGNRLGRISAGGKLNQWELAPGTCPEEIMGCHQGAVFFTCRDRRMIGSFRYETREADAEAVETALETAAAPEFKGPLATPDRSVAKPEVEAALETTAAAESMGSPAMPGRSFAEVVASAAAKPQVLETKAAGGAPRPRAIEPLAGLAPLAQLRAMGLEFGEDAARHILDHHAQGKRLLRASAFEAAWSGRVQLEGLLATVLRRAGGLTREEYPDGRRRQFLTHAETVGSYLEDGTGERVETRKFLLVTRPRNRSEGPGPAQVVVTAYPVP